MSRSGSPGAGGAGVSSTEKMRSHSALDMMSPKWKSTLDGESLDQYMRRSRA